MQTAFADLKAQGLKLDMTRGKPCKDQLDMVSDIFDMLKEPRTILSTALISATTARCPVCRRPSACSQTFWTASPAGIRGGNASLQLMYGVIDCAFIHGRLNSPRPWCKEPVVKWLCPAPGYDRHFKLTDPSALISSPFP